MTYTLENEPPLCSKVYLLGSVQMTYLTKRIDISIGIYSCFLNAGTPNRVFTVHDDACSIQTSGGGKSVWGGGCMSSQPSLHVHVSFRQHAMTKFRISPIPRASVIEYNKVICHICTET